MPQTNEHLQPLDFTYVEDIAAGQTEFLQNLLTVIGKSLDEYPVKIRQHLSAGEVVLFRETVHKFKSSIAYLGVSSFTELLNRLEVWASVNQQDAVLQAELATIDRYAVHLQSEINRKLNELAA